MKRKGETHRLRAGWMGALSRVASPYLVSAVALVLTGCLESPSGTTIRKKSKAALTVIPDAPVEAVVGSSKKSVTITWQASHVKGVNASGGGYRIYYTTDAEMKASTPFKKVTYSSGASAPTSLKLTGLSSGSYNFFIVAYTLLNSTGSAPVPFSVEIP